MKQALVIVDIQNDYFPGGKMELVGIEEAAKNARQALGLFRSKKLAIFHIRHLSNRAGATFFLPETTGAEIHESVAPVHGEYIIQKNFPNSFRETSLERQLHNLAIEQIIICGAMTHMCVDTTVRAAFDLGFHCLVVADACATKKLEFYGIPIEAQQVQAAFMSALSNPFAQVIKVDELTNRFE